MNSTIAGLGRLKWFPIVSLLAVLAALHSFVFVDTSPLHLGNDTSVLGLVASARAFPEHFSRDPVLTHLTIYYTPSHLAILAALLKLTESYIQSLQVVLFVQIALTLLTNAILLVRFFPKLSRFAIVLFAYLITITFLGLPYGECVGFHGLSTALPRSSSWIFVPLIILLYAADRPLRVFGRKIPNFIAIGFSLGLLVNVHPPSGINIFVVLLAHGALFRMRGRRDLSILLAACGMFLAGSAIFLAPYFWVSNHLDAKYGPEYLEYLRNMRPWIKYLWIAKAGFVPFAACLSAYLTFRDNGTVGTAQRNLHIHLLGQLFVIAYGIDVTGSILYAYVTSLAYPLVRTERFEFYLLELLIVCFAVEGADLIQQHREAKDKKRSLLGTNQGETMPSRLKQFLEFVGGSPLRYAFYLAALLIAACASLTVVQPYESLLLSAIPIVVFFGAALLAAPLVPSPLPKLYLLLSGASILWLAGVQMTGAAEEKATNLLVSVGLAVRTPGYSGYLLQSGILGAAVCAVPISIALLTAVGTIRRPKAQSLTAAYLILLLAVVLAFRTIEFQKGVGGVFHGTASSKPQIREESKAFLNDFMEVCHWVNTNTRSDSGVLCLDDGLCQQFKLMARRPGVGAWNEVLWSSVWMKNNYLQDFPNIHQITVYINDPEYIPRLPAIMAKYRLEYIFSQLQVRDNLDSSGLFQEVFINGHFVVYRLR